MSLREKSLFLEALLQHLRVGLLLKVIPFRWIPRLFSSPQSAVESQQFEPLAMEKSRTPGVGVEDQSRYEPVPVKSGVSGRQLMMIEEIRLAVHRAGRVSPWKNRCLVSSLAGRCMLRGRKIDSQLSLGVAKNADSKTIAHAWLRAGDIEIVSAGEGFHELYQF